MRHGGLDRHLYGMEGATATRSDEVPASSVGEAASGDVAALERIVARYQDDMARVCMVVCGGDADLAQDAVQAAWPVAWRKLRSVREPERLRHWLIAVAANEARQLLRKQRRHRVVEIDIADVGSSRNDPADTIPLADLRTALHRLSAEERTLLAMRFVADMDSVDIGEALGITASGARSRLERLLARLRAELEP
jgi:RNA polymerase sigma factor (sigma-70 family)